MSAAFNLSPIARALAAGFMDSLLAGIVIAVFAGLILRVVRKQPSSTRFAVWFAALVAIAALALAGAWWPLRMAPPIESVAPSAEFTVPGSWAIYFFGAWAVMAAFGLTRVVVGLMHLRRLRMSCVPIDAGTLDPELSTTLEHHGARRRVRLYVSEQVEVPTALGFFQPAVIIPRWLIHEISAGELNQVVLHELAHLRRWDDWTNLVQKVVGALFFFHPAVWWIERKVSLEREMACDEVVLAETQSPRAYAECLAHLAEKSFVRRSLALAQAALGRLRQTSLRVARILDGERPVNSRHGWRPAVLVVSGFAVACAACVARAPRLIAFDDGSDNVAAFSPLAASGQGVGARIVPAALKTSNAKAGKGRASLTDLSIPQTNAARIAEQKISGQTRAGGLSAVKREASSPHQSVARILPADFRGSAMIQAQAVFVIMEGSENEADGPSWYRISVWRFTVTQSPADLRPTIPRKQT